MNDETRDHALSRLYREGAWPEPGRQIDQAILAASRRASRERHPFLWRFAPAFAVAATVVLTSAIVLKVYREQPDMLASPVQEKPVEALRSKVVEARQKETDKKPQETAPAAPAPEPQAPPTPRGFSSTMDTAEAARLERAQRDLGLKEPSPAGTAPAAKAAPAAKTAPPRALKKESSAPVEANRERRDVSPQTSTFSVFGASPPSASAPTAAPSQAARAATGKPAQLAPQNAPPAAPSADAASAPQAQAPVSSSGSASASLTVLQAAAPAKVERTPQAWIDDIRKMMKEGRSEEAGEEIAKFKKRYPDYALPEDLR